MSSRLPRLIGKNLGTLFLAIIFAVIVWVTAVTSADPNQERIYRTPANIIGLASNLEITSELPELIDITIWAPSSILDQIAKDNNAIQVWMDISGLENGTHTVPLNYEIDPVYRPLRILDVQPTKYDITLEELIVKTLPITFEVRGEPTLGYQANTPEWSHDEVIISGRVTQVDQVVAVKATLNISGSEETFQRNLTLLALDAAGNVVSDVILTPGEVTVDQTITLRGGYRNMVVKVVTEGQVADGYRQTSISASPPNVMVFSADPQIVDQLPGYIETEPLTLSGAIDDIETNVALSLPEGVSVIGDPSVIVQAGIAAMDGNQKIIRKVEVIGMLPDQEISVSPDTVEVILFGPLPELDTMLETDVRVVIDLTDFEDGIHQVTPEVEILSERIVSESITPGTVEVEIIGPIENDLIETFLTPENFP